MYVCSHYVAFGPQHPQLALVPGKVHMAAAKAKVAAANVILKGVPAASAKVGKQALDEEAPAEEAPAEEAPAEEAPAADAPASDADATDDKPKKKVLGASGEEVLGKKDGAVAGFLGFQEKGEPNLLGMPLQMVLGGCLCSLLSGLLLLHEAAANQNIPAQVCGWGC